MSAISLRLPEHIHDRVRAMAEREGVSINQFITVALAEKLSALLTEEYLGSRAKRASRAKFSRVLKKIADAEPSESDRL